MVNEAKQNEAGDQKFRDLVAARNNADQLIYATEKAVTELGDKLPESEKSNIEMVIKDLNEAKAGEDIDRIKELTERLTQASQSLAQMAAAAAQGEGAPGGPAPGGDAGDDEGVIEGEFQEM